MYTQTVTRVYIDTSQSTFGHIPTPFSIFEPLISDSFCYIKTKIMNAFH